MVSYVIVDDPIAWIDINWTSLDVGSPTEASVQVDRSIRMKVRFIPHDELRDMLPAVLGGNELVKKGVAELARDVCLDWDGPVDADGRAVPFSPEMLDRVIQREVGFPAGFELSYLKAAGGQGKTRLGNSSGSRADGPAPEPKAKARKRGSTTS